MTRRTLFAAWMACLLATGQTTLARAQTSVKDWATNSGSSTIDYVTPRTEVAGFPVLNYSTDFGFRFGAVGSVARFGGGVKPYRWKTTLTAQMAVKSDEGVTVYALPTFLLNQSVTMICPSGLRLGTSRKITLSRIFFTAGD